MRKNRLIFACILVIGIVLRLLFIDKVSGLWYDELVSYKEAFMPDIESVIFYTLKTDVHLPFYPVLLHLWAKIFSFEDISLRLFSAVCGVISIIGAYFAGKELRSAKTGLYCAGLFALNSFMIYYAQEVRMYSLLMMLSCLQLLFLLRIYKRERPNRRDFKYTLSRLNDYLIFSVLSIAIMYTQTIAFIYIFIEIAVFAVYLSSRKEKILNDFLQSTISIIALFLPLLVYLLYFHKNYTEQINGYYCDWSTLFVVMQDFFTPVLAGVNHNPVHYMQLLISTHSFTDFIFIIMPVALFIFLIRQALVKYKFNYVIFLPAIAFVIVEIIAFKTTNFKIMSRYLSIILPNLLLLAGYGLSRTSNKFQTKNLITAFIIAINFSYFVFSPNAAFKIPRNGFRPLAQLINAAPLKDGDFVIVWNRKEILDKYITKKPNVLSILKDFSYRSEVILHNEKTLNKLPLEERKALLRDYFGDNYIPRNTRLLLDFIILNMKSGQKFIVTTSTYNDSFTRKDFVELVRDDSKYSAISYNDLLTIKSLIDIKTHCRKKLNFVSKNANEGYTVYVFEK